MSNVSVEGTAQIVEQDYVSLQVVEQPTGPNVDLEYHTLNGNSPQSNKNYIGLWQSSDGVVPNKKAKWSSPVPKDESADGITLWDIPINDNAFVLGYCQTGDPKMDLAAANNVSATAVIDRADNLKSEALTVMSLDVQGDSSSFKVFYKILKGTNYATHWLGFWKEDQSIDFDEPFYPMLVKEADSKKTGGFVVKDPEGQFQRGTKYTLAYFADGYSNDSTKKNNVSNMMGYIKFLF